MLLLRDYSQDLDAMLISKPARLTPEMLSLYQDHVAKPLMKNVTADGNMGAQDIR